MYASTHISYILAYINQSVRHFSGPKSNQQKWQKNPCNSFVDANKSAHVTITIFLRKNLCQEAAEMKREEFRRSFLDPLIFTHSDPGSRSPQEFKGHKNRGDLPGTIRGVNYGLFKVDFKRKKGFISSEVSLSRDFGYKYFCNF